MNDTVVITYGRFNPVHKGHELVYNTMVKQRGDKTVVFTSESHDAKKNPIGPIEKVKFLKKAFSTNEIYSVKGGVIEAVKRVSPAKKLIVIVGGDRVREFKKLLNAYNHRDYEFDQIEIVEAGTRVGTISASLMRQYAMSGDYKKWSANCPSHFSEKDKQQMFIAVRDGMGVENADIITESAYNKRLLGRCPANTTKYVANHLLEHFDFTNYDSTSLYAYLDQQIDNSLHDDFATKLENNAPLCYVNVESDVTTSNSLIVSNANYKFSDIKVNEIYRMIDRTDNLEIEQGELVYQIIEDMLCSGFDIDKDAFEDLYTIDLDDVVAYKLTNDNSLQSKNIFRDGENYKSCVEMNFEANPANFDDPTMTGFVGRLTLLSGKRIIFEASRVDSVIYDEIVDDQSTSVNDSELIDG